MLLFAQHIDILIFRNIKTHTCLKITLRKFLSHISQWNSFLFETTNKIKNFWFRCAHPKDDFLNRD